MPHFYNSVGIIFQRLQLFEPGDDTQRSTVANLGGTCPYITQIHVQNIIQEMAPLRGINDSFFPCSDFAFIPIIEEIGI